MATPYSSIYERFLPKISDYTFLTLSESGLENNIKPYLLASITKFKRCKTDLSQRDDNLKLFFNDLSDEEMEILSMLMLVEFLSPKLVTSDLLQQTLSSKDYAVYSQANHIREIRLMRDGFKTEAESAIKRYTYYNNSLDDMQ